MHETTVRTIFSMRDSELLNIFEVFGSKMVEITDDGETALELAIETGRDKE